MKPIISTLLLLVIITSDLLACEIKHVFKPSDTDKGQYYPTLLLTHLLKLTEEDFGKCALVEVGIANHPRQIAWLQNNSIIDIAWLPATDNVNKSLLPIEVPIRKGFLGWRLLMVDKNNAPSFTGVSTLEQLNQFTAGFGRTWGDLSVMQHNFTTVVTGMSYDSIFDMLIRERFDFLSRPVYEAYDEVLERSENQPALMIQPNIALHYRQADFFYVNPTNARLYKRLTLGFKKAIDDGSFDRLFYTFYADYIDQLGMDERIIINLENPFLPENVPIGDPELWFQLDVYERLKLKPVNGFESANKRAVP